jgi:hypothetical protein
MNEDNIYSPYHQDPDVRCRIDEAMKETAFLMSRKGTRQQYTDGSVIYNVKKADRATKQLVDELPEEEAEEWYRKQEIKLLKKVMKYDPDFIKKLTSEQD